LNTVNKYPKELKMDAHTIKPQDFSKNEDEDLSNAINNPQQHDEVPAKQSYHADEEPWLLSCATHTSVTNDTDGETSSETSETDR
jgi:hypothetical protein